MSGFLQKLKSGGVVVDNNAPPDNQGVVTRKLAKNFMDEPFDKLGLALTDDCEVSSVIANSLAHTSNIPPHYMIFEVNNQFIENRAQFVDIANSTLNLIIKLQSVSAMSELIAKILSAEESSASENGVQLDELTRTTTRYSFLSSEHPLFRRYTRRLAERREAAALIKQRAYEAEQQNIRETKERMRRELEEEEAKKAKEAAEKIRLASKAASIDNTTQNSEPFLKVFTDESAFGKNTEVSIPVEAPVVEVSSTTPPPVDQQALTSELLALVGIPQNVNIHYNAPALPPIAEPTAYVTLPAEEYSLPSGEKVISTLKKRSGPLPSAPPGKPPRVTATKNGNRKTDEKSSPSNKQRELSSRKRDHRDRDHYDNRDRRSDSKERRMRRRQESRDRDRGARHHRQSKYRD